MNGQRHLRLVEPPSPRRPQRIEVRISAADGRSAFGRSRAFRLAESDVELLVAAAMRMEARA
jgi:hypothetical protein